MTSFTDEQTWNKEQIEAAFNTFEGDSIEWTKRHLIAELTKPKPVFKENEIVISYVGAPVRWKEEYGILDYRRPTPEEVPLWEKDKKALALAIESLEEVLSQTSLDGFVQTALDDIKAMK